MHLIVLVCFNFQSMSNCVAFVRETSTNYAIGEWGDEGCNNKYNYICKGMVAPANPPPTNTKCTMKGFETYWPYNENCYSFSKQAKSWHDAEKDCQSQGAHLISITDTYEQSFVFSHMNSEIVWIGLGNVEVKNFTFISILMREENNII